MENIEAAAEFVALCYRAIADKLPQIVSEEALATLTAAVAANASED